MVSGVVALMLEANPLLSWRDVRWLLARTARPADLGSELAEPSVMNAHGFYPRVGFGRVHAGDAVAAARSFSGLPTERRCDSGILRIDLPIGDRPAPALVSSNRLEGCDLKIVESVQIRQFVMSPLEAANDWRKCPAGFSLPETDSMSQIVRVSSTTSPSRFRGWPDIERA
jgi:hypothetical protein